MDEEGFIFSIPLSIEMKYPNRPWESIWPLIALRGLESSDSSFLFRLIHNLLPSQERVSKVVKQTNPQCSLCNMNVIGDQMHELITCRSTTMLEIGLLDVFKGWYQVHPQKTC